RRGDALTGFIAQHVSDCRSSGIVLCSRPKLIGRLRAGSQNLRQQKKQQFAHRRSEVIGAAGLPADLKCKRDFAESSRLVWIESLDLGETGRKQLAGNDIRNCSEEFLRNRRLT